jgi:hypothetical protein
MFTAPYHPQANPVERKNKDIKNYLMKYALRQHSVWDEFVDLMMFTLRTCKIKSTGLTPAQVLLGRNLTAPLDVFKPDPEYNIPPDENIRDYAKRVEHRIKLAVRYLMESKELASLENKMYYDPNHVYAEFTVGDWVTIVTHPLSDKAEDFAAKLAPTREGPYVVIKRLNPLNYELGDIHTKQLVTFAHVVQMKMYYPREGQELMTHSDEPNLIDRPKPKRPPAVKRRLGLGKQKGRPVGSTNKPAIKTTPLGQTRAVTRSQTASQTDTSGGESE